MLDKTKTAIYRMIHVNNLSLVLKDRYVYAKNFAPHSDECYCDIADKELQLKRGDTHVSLPPYGTLHDYVPFYFCPRSPMMYRLYMSDEDQSDLIYLVTYVERVEAYKYDFVFTNRHAISRGVEWYKSLRYLDTLDWACINDRSWGVDQPGYVGRPDVKERSIRKQAEFLVHRRAPLLLFRHIVTMDERARSIVEEEFEKKTLNFKIDIGVNPDWYF